MYKACVIVLSNREYTGEEEDSAGRKLEKYIEENNFEILVYKIIPEVKNIYKEFLVKCCDNYCVDIVITIGNKCLSEETAKEINEEVNIELNSYRRKKTIIKNFEENISREEIELEKLVEGIKRL